MSGKRRRWTAEEKLRIVLAGLGGDIEVSELGTSGDRARLWIDMVCQTAYD